MQRLLVIVAAIAICPGCGPGHAPDVNEPADPGRASPAGEGETSGHGDDAKEAAAETPGHGDDAAGQEEETGGGVDGGKAETPGHGDGEEKQTIVGSSSQDEIVPIKQKDYDVDIGVDFAKSPGAEGKQAVMQKVAEAGMQITMCYRKLVLEDEKLQGDMEVSMEIRPGGAAKPVKLLKDSTGSDALTACTVKELKKQKYPKMLGGKQPLSVTVTLEFRSSMD
jgi:hypothetical protein